jgi:hypothetical protein
MNPAGTALSLKGDFFDPEYTKLEPNLSLHSNTKSHKPVVLKRSRSARSYRACDNSIETLNS